MNRNLFFIGFALFFWLQAVSSFYYGMLLAVAALADLDAQLAIDADSNRLIRAQIDIVRGDSAPARAWLARLSAAADSSRFAAFNLAALEAALGRREEALATLKRLRERPAPFTPECAPGVPCSGALDVWITNTQAWVPGVYMFYKQPDAEIRRKIILYLKANR